jgi:hypothetical protein
MPTCGNGSQLQSRQVAPLPCGPGGSNSTKAQLNDNNTALTMMQVQASADSMCDPPIPKPTTQPVVSQQGFCSSSTSFPTMIGVIGILFIVYGLVKKR